MQEGEHPMPSYDAKNQKPPDAYHVDITAALQRAMMFFPERVSDDKDVVREKTMEWITNGDAATWGSFWDAPERADLRTFVEKEWRSHPDQCLKLVHDAWHAYRQTCDDGASRHTASGHGIADEQT